MSDAAPDIAPAETPDPAIERMERRLLVLEDMSRIGMQLVRPLCADGGIDPLEAADAYAKLSRSVRLTLTLEMRVETALHALRTGGVPERTAHDGVRSSARRDAPAVVAQDDDIEPAEDLREGPETETLGDPAESECDNFGDLSAIERALDERLEQEAPNGGFGGAPPEEIAWRLGVELQLIPDLGIWIDTARAPRSTASRPSRSSGESPSLPPSAAYAAVHSRSIESRRPRLE